MITSNKKSFIENICSLLFEKASKYRYVLAGSLLVAFLTYTFAFVHKLPNCDDVVFYFFQGEVATDHGRWMLDVMNWIMPGYSMPWIYGVLSILILSIANCFIVNIFKIENKYLQILWSGLFISFQSVVGTLSYMFLSYMYATAFLLSVISVYIYQKHGLKYKIWSIITMIISMGFYQAYWAMGAVFFIVLMFKDIIENKKTAKNIFIDGIKYAGYICITAILYYAVNTLIFYIFNIEFNGYTSDRVNNSWPLSERLYWTVVNMISLFFYGIYGFVVTSLSKFLHWIFIIFISLLVTIPTIKAKSWGKVVLAVFLLCIFPIAMNCVNIITPAGTHTLTLITFSSLYLLVIVLVQYHIKKTIVYDLMLVALALLLCNNILVANKNYLKQYLQYENAKSFYTGVMVRVEQTPGFDEKSKLALMGKATIFINDMSDFPNDDITGIEAKSIINYYSRSAFMRNYVGFTIPFATKEECKNISKTDVFMNMPNYPFAGSVRKFGNIVVVKFSNDND